MASTNIARLGVVLGLDMAEFTAGIEKAVKENKKLSSAIKSDSNAAAKEIMALKYATDTYNKSLTKTEEIQKATTTGRYAFATKELKEQLMAAAKAYDQLAMSAGKAQKAQGTGMLGAQGDKLNPQQLAALGYQTTDIVTSLAGGQNPLLVLLQQGGQLRDQFGGVTNVFKAFASVLTPLRLAIGGVAAVVGTLSFAFFKGMSESQRLRDDLILTGNIAGIVNNKFELLSRSLSKDLSTSIGNAKEIFSGLIASGRFTQETMVSVGQAIAMVSKLSGESAGAVTKDLINSFDGSAASAKKLNDQYNFLNVTQYRYIEQLQQQGKLQESAKYTADLLTESFKNQERNLGLIERTLSSVKKGFSEFWDAALDIGRDKTDAQRLDDLNKKIKELDVESPNANSQFRQLRLRKLREAIADRNVLQEKIKADEEKAAADSAEKAKNKADLEARIKAGGLQKEQALEFEYRKQMSDNGMQMAMNGANEAERIRIESLKKIASVSLKYEQEMLQSGGVFGGALTRNLLAEIDAISKEANQKIQEVSRQRFREISERQTAEENTVQKEREKLELYKENILLSDTDYQIALDRLRTEQEIAKIMSDQRLSDADKQSLADREARVQQQREEVVKLGESLKVLRDINKAVFQNMTDALTNFIMTGKLNFKGFAQTVITEILRIQAASIAAQATRGIMGAIGNVVGNMFGGMGTAFSYGTNVGSQQTSMLAAQDAGLRAGGGDIRGGQPAIVGDAGPELFIPRNAGTIVPNSQLAGAMSGGGVVNNYYIDAIDTKSFEDRILGSSNTVWAANQYANKTLAVGRGRT
jgi:phage-related minor tail protein